MVPSGSLLQPCRVLLRVELRSNPNGSSHLLSQTLVPYGQPMLTRIMLGLVLLLLLLVLLMLLLMLLLLLLATVFADKIHAGASLVVVVAVAVDAAAVVATVVAAGWEVSTYGT